MATYDIYVNTSMLLREQLASFAFIIQNNNWTICRHAAPITNDCRTSTEAELMAIGHAINYIRLKGDRTASIRIHSQSHGAIRFINGTPSDTYNTNRYVTLVELIREFVYSDMVAVYDNACAKEIRWCDFHAKKINRHRRSRG